MSLFVNIERLIWVLHRQLCTLFN